MTMRAICLGVAAVLVVALATSVNATIWMKWSDQTTPWTMDGPSDVGSLYSTVFGEPAEASVYQFGDIANPAYLQTDGGADHHDVAVPNHLYIEGGRTDPSSDLWFDPDSNYPIYVRIVFQASNSGTTNWTDFHLRAVENCTVYKLFGSEVGWDTNKDDLGWDAIYNPDPLAYNDPPIQPGELFYNETWIVVDPSADHWKVDVWPTPVPEPTALCLFGAGMAFLRAFSRRKN